MVLAATVSVQFGAALATHLFHRVGPSGTVALRLSFAAVMVAVVVIRVPGFSGGAGWRLVRAMTRADLGVAVAFGVVLAGMNLCFYEAIARVPLGVAVTVEFSGPLAVALSASRRPADLVWAAAAAAGVVLLAGGVGRHLDPGGIALALAAAACWAGYILLSAETGRRFPRATGLAVAMVASAVIGLPLGIARAGAHLFRPEVLGVGLAVALLSSALPYSLELAALRRLSARAFGILMSLDPAVAAVAGLVVLGQRLGGAELAALALVIVANLGSAWSDRGGGAATLPAAPGKTGAATGVAPGAGEIRPESR